MAVTRSGLEARIVAHAVDGGHGHLGDLDGCHHVGNVFNFVEQIIVATVRR